MSYGDYGNLEFVSIYLIKLKGPSEILAEFWNGEISVIILKAS